MDGDIDVHFFLFLSFLFCSFRLCACLMHDSSIQYMFCAVCQGARRFGEPSGET